MSAERGRRIRHGLAAALVLALVATFLSLARGARLERADFAFNNGAEVTTLDPAAVSGQPEGRVLLALYEGLTVPDPRTLASLPGAAEAWEVSADGLRYLFHLRAGLQWSNGDPCGAQDFEWSWQRLLAPETSAEYAYLLWCVRGARAFTLSAAQGAARNELWKEVGIRARDARTLEVELEHPTPYFLALTGYHPLFPVHRASLERARERFPDSWQTAWIRPDLLVTNGPYLLSERRVNDRLRLTRNPAYWDADSVAFETIDVLAVEHYGTILNLYLAGEVDWVDRVPPNLVPRLLPREDFAPAPYLASYFYRVNVTRPPLNDPRVRRALALSIDRRSICEKIGRKGERPSWSLTPPGLEGYPRPEMAHASVAPDLSDYDAAFAQDCARARELLREAGLGQESSPAVAIHYNTSEAHRDIAEVIAEGWKRALGIDARLVNQEWKVYLDTQKTLGYDVSRSSWIADYADPNTFLDVFVGGGENNRTGWSAARYDELLRQAAGELDRERRLECLARAESILLEELPVFPIYGYVSQNLVNPRLGGFFENPRDLHPPKFFYWMDDEELVQRRSQLSADRRVVPARGPAAGLYPRRARAPEGPSR